MIFEVNEMEQEREQSTESLPVEKDAFFSSRFIRF